MFECLLFSSSLLSVSLNPAEPTYDIAESARYQALDDYELMSLLSEDELEDAANARFELYDAGGRASDSEAYLTNAFCRVVGSLVKGERLSTVTVRSEDPIDLSWVPVVSEFVSYTRGKLLSMTSLIVKRQADEENDGY